MDEGTVPSANRKTIMLTFVDEEGVLWEWDAALTGAKTIEELKEWIANGFKE